MNNKKILLVEDEAVVAIACERALGGFGIDTIFADTGEKAVEIVSGSDEICLVLMDIVLGGGIDGIETATKIHQLSDIPVIFLTSHLSDEMVRRINDVRHSGCILKNSGDLILKVSIDRALKEYELERENRRYYDELAINENRYRAAFLESPEAINIHNMNGVFVDINNAFTDLTGYTREEVIGKTADDLNIWTDPDANKKLAESLKINCHVENMEAVLRWKGERLATVILSGKFINIDNKKHVMIVTRDINERKKIEEQLRESEEKYRATFITSPDSISINTLDGIYTDINDSFTRITGFSRDDIIGRKASEIGIWAELGDLKSLVKDLEIFGFVENRDLIFRTKSGEIKTSLMSARLIKINGIPHVLSITRDFTERNRVLEALRKSEKGLANAQARAHLGSWEADYVNKTSSWSAEMYRLFGINPDDGPLIDLEQLVSVIHPDDVQRVVDNEFRLVQKKEILKSEYRIIRSNDNAVRWFESQMEPVLDDSQNVTGIVGTVLDITDRKVSAEALRESEEKFRSIAENISDMIFITDNDGIIKYLSDSSYDIFGYKPEEMNDHFFGDYLSEGELERVFPFFEQAIRTGEPAKNINFVSTRRDGTNFYAELSSSIIKKDGVVVGALGAIRDISDRMESENRIKKLLGEKELLLKEVHHRVKNNMSIIMSLLSLQADALKDSSAASALMDAKIRMQSMGVLYDRLYRSESFMEMAIDEYLPPLIDEIFSMFPRKANIEIRKNIESCVLPYKTLSALGILTNEIITNTLKHAFAGKEKGNITVSFSVENSIGCLAISDDGVGMDESIDASNTEGFGLQLVGLLARQIGGDMNIVSKNGTMFTLQFKI